MCHDADVIEDVFREWEEEKVAWLLGGETSFIL